MRLASLGADVLTLKKKPRNVSFEYTDFLVIFTSMELVFKLIPTTLFQVVAILESIMDDETIAVDPALVTSIVVSAGIAAMSVTYMSTINDADPEMRGNIPIFYGFLPTTGKRFIAVRVGVALLSFEVS